MEASPERRVDQARERFQLQDYYGAIHLLEEIVAIGHAYADAEHMLGLCYSLVGQAEKSLAHLDPNPRAQSTVRQALVHRALVLNDLRRELRPPSLAAGRADRRRVTGSQPPGGETREPARHAEARMGLTACGSDRMTPGRARLGPEFHDLRYKLGRLLQAGRVLEARSNSDHRSLATQLPRRLPAQPRQLLDGDDVGACGVGGLRRRRRDPRIEAYLAMLDGRSDPQTSQPRGPSASVPVTRPLAALSLSALRAARQI
jgi:hypothetical protein